MKHEVTWDEGVGCVRLRLVGEFAPAEATLVMQQVCELFEDKQRRLFLIDHTLSPRAVSRETRAAIEEHGQAVDAEKVAFFGMTNLNRVVARIIISILGKSSHTKFFVSEDEALAWFDED